jgi:hypothetical protein
VNPVDWSKSPLFLAVSVVLTGAAQSATHATLIPRPPPLTPNLEEKKTSLTDPLVIPPL